MNRLYDFRNPEYMQLGSDGKYVPTRPFRTITKPCPFCSKTSFILADREDLDEWQTGASIQSVFYWLTPQNRETIITGAHTRCL